MPHHIVWTMSSHSNIQYIIDNSRNIMFGEKGMCINVIDSFKF